MGCQEQEPEPHPSPGRGRPDLESGPSPSLVRIPTITEAVNGTSGAAAVGPPPSRADEYCTVPELLSGGPKKRILKATAPCSWKSS